LHIIIRVSSRAQMRVLNAPFQVKPLDRPALLSQRSRTALQRNRRIIERLAQTSKPMTSIVSTTVFASRLNCLVDYGDLSASEKEILLSFL
jgi:hypothetical protein